MSAFVVDPETIDVIVSAAIGANEARYNGPWPDARYIDAPAFQFAYGDEEAAAYLGKRLYQMNIAAVEQRYPQLNETDLPGTIGEDEALAAYTFGGRQYTVAPLRVYKAIACLIYQCSEGDVPEWPLFKELQNFQNAIAGRIIRNMPQYDALPWG